MIRYIYGLRFHKKEVQNQSKQIKPQNAYQQIELLHNIQEHLVLLVLDALRTPADGVCDG